MPNYFKSDPPMEKKCCDVVARQFYDIEYHTFEYKYSSYRTLPDHVIIVIICVFIFYYDLSIHVISLVRVRIRWRWFLTSPFLRWFSTHPRPGRHV